MLQNHGTINWVALYKDQLQDGPIFPSKNSRKRAHPIAGLCKYAKEEGVVFYHAIHCVAPLFALAPIFLPLSFIPLAPSVPLSRLHLPRDPQLVVEISDAVEMRQDSSGEMSIRKLKFLLNFANIVLLDL